MVSGDVELLWARREGFVKTLGNVKLKGLDENQATFDGVVTWFSLLGLIRDSLETSKPSLIVLFPRY